MVSTRIFFLSCSFSQSPSFFFGSFGQHSNIDVCACVSIRLSIENKWWLSNLTFHAVLDVFVCVCDFSTNVCCDLFDVWLNQVRIGIESSSLTYSVVNLPQETHYVMEIWIRNSMPLWELIVRITCLECLKF